MAPSRLDSPSPDDSLDQRRAINATELQRFVSLNTMTLGTPFHQLIWIDSFFE
jgi:hypothetical protein